jgi:hypothetical protein
MAFNRNYYKGATSEDLKKALAYHTYLISNAEAEALKQTKQAEIYDSSNTYANMVIGSKTEDIIGTIKSNLIINGDSEVQLSHQFSTAQLRD